MITKKKRIRRLTASVTELTQFQSCRRRWYLGRQYTSSTESPAFLFGSAIHKGLEGYYSAKKQRPNEPELWKAAMLSYYSEFCVEAKGEARRDYGFLWEQAEQAYDDLLELGRRILINYIDYDKTAEIPFTPRLVEKRIFIPLDVEKRDVLTMRWDVLGTTYHNLSAIMDHKTVSGSIHSSGSILDLDEQMTGYAWGYWRVHNRQRLVDLVIYDVVNKKIPASIRVLKSGKLSTDKSQDTVLPILMATIREFGDDENRFYDLIAVLEEKGWSGFFNRECSPRNENQLRNYEERVKIIFKEMREVIENPKLAYPSPSPITCRNCPFLTVCTSMEDGSDYKYLLAATFNKYAKTHYTLPPRFRDMTG